MDGAPKNGIFFSTPSLGVFVCFGFLCNLALRKQDKERNPLLGRSGFFVVGLFGCWTRCCEADHAEVRLAVVLLIHSEELDALAFGHTEENFHRVAVLQGGVVCDQGDLTALGGLRLREGVLGSLLVLANAGFRG
jgi:hypothetical protein